MNKQKNYLTQQIHSFHLKNPLMQIVKHLLVCVPFSLGSICEHWIYVRVDWSSKCVLLWKPSVNTLGFHNKYSFHYKDGFHNQYNFTNNLKSKLN